MEQKSVSKLISSLSISPFLHARHDRLQAADVLRFSEFLPSWFPNSPLPYTRCTPLGAYFRRLKYYQNCKSHWTPE